MTHNRRDSPISYRSEPRAQPFDGNPIERLFLSPAGRGQGGGPPDHPPALPLPPYPGGGRGQFDVAHNHATSLAGSGVPFGHHHHPVAGDKLAGLVPADYRDFTSAVNQEIPPVSPLLENEGGGGGLVPNRHTLPLLPLVCIRAGGEEVGNAPKWGLPKALPSFGGVKCHETAWAWEQSPAPGLDLCAEFLRLRAVPLRFPEIGGGLLGLPLGGRLLLGGLLCGKPAFTGLAARDHALRAQTTLLWGLVGWPLGHNPRIPTDEAGVGDRATPITH